MPDDIERRLEEVFMDDSRSRRVERVDVRPRRRSPLLVPLAIAGAAVVALAVGLTLGSLREQRQEAAAPSASPSVTASPAGGTPAVTPSGSPAARAGEYTSPLGYTVQLPTGWRRSELLSRAAPLPQGDTESLAADVFTIRAAADEQRLIAARTGGTGLGPELFYTASVSIDRNTRGLDPKAFAQRNQGALGFQVVGVEDHPFEGRVGAKTTWRVAANDPRTFYAIYLPDETRRIWTIGFFLSYSAQDVPPGATEQALRTIVDSFRFNAATASPGPATGSVPAEDLGIVTFVEQRPGGQTTVLVRGERDARAFASLGAIGLTSDGRNAGAVSPDGRRFAFWQPESGRVGGASKRLLLWDAADPTKASTLLEAPSGEYGDAVAWSSDGRGLLLSYTSVATLPGTPIRRQYGVLRLYDLTTRALAGRELQRDGALTPLAWDRAGGRIAYFMLSGSNANAYRVESEHDPSGPISVSMAGAYHLSGSPDGAWVVARVATRRLRAWPRESPERAVEIEPQHSDTLSHHGWRPGANEVLVGDHALVQPGFGAGVVSLWDPSTGRRSEIAGARTMPFAFRADGSAVYLATGAAPWRYVIHEIASGRRSDLPAGPEDAHIVAAVRLR